MGFLKCFQEYQVVLICKHPKILGRKCERRNIDFKCEKTTRICRTSYFDYWDILWPRKMMAKDIKVKLATDKITFYLTCPEGCNIDSIEVRNFWPKH